VELDYQNHSGFPDHFCKRRLTVIDNFRIARHPPAIASNRQWALDFPHENAAL